MHQPERIVIVGGGLAAATAAGRLRAQGFTGELSLLGQEAHRPYELPPLSKAVLLGETDEPDWVHPEGYYAENGINLRSGRAATGIELGSRLVRDDRGAEYPYDRLLLATGSRPRSLPVPGADLPGVATLRTIDDSLALRGAFTKSEHVVVIGGGWIGTEAAAAARAHGAGVTLVERDTLPLHTVLGTEVAGVFRDLHAEHGVEFRLGRAVREFTGGASGLRGVRLDDGTEIVADTALVAVGAAPRVELAHEAGLELAEDGGVSVDAVLRTATPDVYAVGDIASHFHPGYGTRVRVEHWDNAKRQGAHVAANLLGEEQPYQASPFFFSDQYDLGCEYRGRCDTDTAELVVRGELATREFIAFWLHDGRVHAALNVNVFDSGPALNRLVDNRAAVSADQLRTAELASLG